MKNQQTENQEYLCNKHSQPILMVQMDNNDISFQDRFICSQCFKIKKQGTIHIMSFDEAKDIICKSLQPMKEDFDANKNLFLQSLHKFLRTMKQRKQEVSEIFDSIIKTLQIWIEKTQSTNVNILSTMISPTNLTEQILNTPYLKIIEESLNKINYQSDLITFQKKLNPESTKKVKLNPIEQKKISKIELLTIKRQPYESKASAFDKTGTILASGSQDFILIFSIEQNKLIEKSKLRGHTGIVTCIVFSKKENWFISGSEDNTIITWIEQQNWIWKGCLQQDIKHTKTINCLILNQIEDQLISCSQDSTINVWQFNCKENKLTYFYTLEQRHTGQVYSITMNESETSLVSYSDNRELILWIKQDEKWVYSNHISTWQQGFRVSFLNDTQIIHPKIQGSIVDIYENKNGQLIKNNDMGFEISKTIYQDEQNLFPIVVLKQQKLVILKQNLNVHILQIQENGRILPLTKIRCSSPVNYGTVSENGQYLFIWNGKKQHYRLYQIIYE